MRINIKKHTADLVSSVNEKNIDPSKVDSFGKEWKRLLR